jgi:hypothetical protein
MATNLSQIVVPESELPRLRSLVKLTPEILEKIAAIIDQQPPSIEPETLSRTAAEELSLSDETIYSLILLFWRWCFAYRKLGMSSDAFIEGVSSGLDSLPIDKWNEEHRDNWNKILPIIKRLISDDSKLVLSAKASGLLQDQHLLLCNSQVITDIRPVFDDSASTIKAFLAFHTLVLRCHEGDTEKNIYVVLDLQDVRKLREQLERAEQKEQLVKSNLMTANFTVIGTENNSDES